VDVGVMTAQTRTAISLQSAVWPDPNKKAETPKWLSRLALRH